jgi:hypothetical protein
MGLALWAKGLFGNPNVVRYYAIFGNKLNGDVKTYSELHNRAARKSNEMFSLQRARRTTKIR